MIVLFLTLHTSGDHPKKTWEEQNCVQYLTSLRPHRSIHGDKADWLDVIWFQISRNKIWQQMVTRQRGELREGLGGGGNRDQIKIKLLQFICISKSVIGWWHMRVTCKNCQDGTLRFHQQNQSTRLSGRIQKSGPRQKGYINWQINMTESKSNRKKEKGRRTPSVTSLFSTEIQMLWYNIHKVGVL